MVGPAYPSPERERGGGELCSFPAHTFLAWQDPGKSSFGPPAGKASQPAAPLTPTDGDPGGQVTLTVHFPYSITASSMTVKPLRRQNVIQHQVAGQENRMRHQECLRVTVSPVGSYHQTLQTLQPSPLSCVTAGAAHYPCPEWRRARHITNRLDRPRLLSTAPPWLPSHRPGKLSINFFLDFGKGTEYCNYSAYVTSSLQGFGRPSVYHAAIVIFLEFFAWGLLTTPMLNVLHDTFPQHTFLMNGLIQGVKGLLSFLSAPLIGALSDVWGRKPFLLCTVFFTCFPIPLMKISPWWYFAMISMSGVFSVTFSVIFAYVADITQAHERSTAYGWVSATFAASLVSSPAIGALLSASYGDSLVVLVATVVALLDICFILLAVPESLPEKMRPLSWGAQISWRQADPFA
ncbi:hypothetical protein CB1_001157001, partial [Camelus ferus]